MNEELLDAINELKTEINKDKRVILLEKLSLEVDNSLEVQKLSMIMNEKASLYEDALKHLGENDSYTLNCQKELYLAKKSLDEHPLVISYNNAYKEVRKIYEKINIDLFAPFKKKCEVK